jgi:hypothetical protein
MGNLCNTSPTIPLNPRPLSRPIPIRKDSLFTIPELSLNLEYSEAKSTPLVTPLNTSLSKKN